MSGRRGAVYNVGDAGKEACKKNCYDQYPGDNVTNQDAIRECIKTNCGIGGGRKRKSRRNSRKNKRSKRKSQKTAKSNKKR
jgi:hypothetical protein